MRKMANKTIEPLQEANMDTLTWEDLVSKINEIIKVLNDLWLND